MASLNRRSELCKSRLAIVYWYRAESILRSFSSGCENATWNPDSSAGSKLVRGLVGGVRAVSHDRLHVPEPHGSRWRTPVDENKSSSSPPRSPSSELYGGVTVLEGSKTG